MFSTVENLLSVNDERHCYSAYKVLNNGNLFRVYMQNSGINALGQHNEVLLSVNDSLCCFIWWLQWQSWKSYSA